MAETSIYLQYLTKPSQIRQYKLKVKNKVNDNEVVVNKKSNDIQVEIQKNYDNIMAVLKAIANNYRECAKKSVKGDTICSSLKKLANTLDKQADNCYNRKQQMIRLYTANATKKNIGVLENALGSDLIMNGDILYHQDDAPNYTAYM
jgi:hypothetical protein